MEHFMIWRIYLSAFKSSSTSQTALPLTMSHNQDEHHTSNTIRLVGQAYSAEFRESAGLRSLDKLTMREFNQSDFAMLSPQDHSVLAA